MSANLLESFALLAASEGGVAKLRELILSLAVRGQLVPQDPADEPASELLKRIRAEKERRVAEGKIKREKVLPTIGEEEKPFELPDSWEWSRLGQISSRVQYGYTASADHTIPTPKLLRITDIQNDKVDWTSVPGVQVNDDDLSGYLLEAGDLLIARTGGTIGKSFLVESAPVDSVFASYLIRISPLAGVTPPFLKTFASSNIYWSQLLAKSMGTGQPNVNGTSLSELVIPLPPLPEQSRIVAKVEALMALCDRLEALQGETARVQAHWTQAALDQLAESGDAAEFARNWQALADHFDTLFATPASIDALDATLLQLAVRGKLLPQNPADEPASELLKKIRAEKDRLIAAGQIKRDKPLPPIADDEKPFELPEGWAWGRFPELGEFGRGKSKHRPRNDPALFNPGIYPLVQTGEVSRANRTVREYHSRYSEVGLAQSKLWPAGTLCITIAANIAESAILGFDACFPDSVVGFVPSPIIGDARYFLTFVETAREHLLEFAPSTAQKNINLEILQSILIPIPPLTEMNRIVAKLDELLALTRTLRARLTDARALQARLASALVDEVAA